MKPSRLAAVILVIAAFAVGTVVNSYLPNLEKIMVRPFVMKSSVETPQQLRSGSVVLSAPALTKQVELHGRVLTSPGAFLSFEVTLEPSGETAGVGAIRFRSSDGRLFGGRQMGAYSPQCVGSQPGIPITCRVFIEVSDPGAPTAEDSAVNTRDAGDLSAESPAETDGTAFSISGSVGLANFGSALGDELLWVQLPELELQSNAVPEVGTRVFGAPAATGGTP